MSIRSHAEEIVNACSANLNPGDKERLIDAIVSLAVATYNKGIARAGESGATPDKSIDSAPLGQ